MEISCLTVTASDLNRCSSVHSEGLVDALTTICLGSWYQKLDGLQPSGPLAMSVLAAFRGKLKDIPFAGVSPKMFGFPLASL